MDKMNKKKRLSDWYVYDWNYSGLSFSRGFTLRGRSEDNSVANKVGREMNVLVRHIWGVGYSLNAIFTSHVAPIFQSYDKETNVKRARLVTKIWRYCKRNGIEINSENFPSQPKRAKRDNPLNEIVYRLDKGEVRKYKPK